MILKKKEKQLCGGCCICTKFHGCVERKTGIKMTTGTLYRDEYNGYWRMMQKSDERFMCTQLMQVDPLECPRCMNYNDDQKNITSKNKES